MLDGNSERQLIQTVALLALDAGLGAGLDPAGPEAYDASKLDSLAAAVGAAYLARHGSLGGLEGSGRPDSSPTPSGGISGRPEAPTDAQGTPLAAGPPVTAGEAPPIAPEQAVRGEGGGSTR